MRRLPLLCLLLFSGCLRPTYPADRVAESVAELCRKEPGLPVRARLVGHTLYVLCDLQGLVGADLGLDAAVLEKLEKIMLNGTRVSLSSDAVIDFLVVVARDPRLKTGFTLLRYIPDIKGLIYMRYSRDDFENRLVLESDTLSAEDETGEWHDVRMPEFIARLISSRLQRQLTANPLVGVFLRLQSLRGEVRGRDLVMVLKRQSDDDLTESAKEPADSSLGLPKESSRRLRRRPETENEELASPGMAVLETALLTVAADVLKKYDGADHFQRILVEEAVRTVWERAKRDLLAEAARLPKSTKD